MTFFVVGRKIGVVCLPSLERVESVEVYNGGGSEERERECQKRGRMGGGVEEAFKSKQLSKVVTRGKIIQMFRKKIFNKFWVQNLSHNSAHFSIFWDILPHFCHIFATFNAFYCI